MIDAMRCNTALAFVVVFLAASGGLAARARPSGSVRAQSPAPSSAAIQWALEGRPATTIRMSQRANFEIWIVAHNAGTQTVDTNRNALEFVVNGATSRDLELAFGNGGRELRWSALPPGETVREPRAMGESLFPRPGTYVFVLRLGGSDVARLQVVVTA